MQTEQNENWGNESDLLKAVALYYDEESAPIITAKGAGEQAQEIIDIAQEHNVPLCESQGLVDLLSTMDIGENIPKTLYTTVAHIIAFAYELRGQSPQQP